MGRLFSVLLLAAALMLTPAQRMDTYAQPVFFSLLFPQLIPPQLAEATAGEAVLL